jgi:ABC-type transport system substrate-binding protein
MDTAMPVAFGASMPLYILPEHKLSGMAPSDLVPTWTGAFPGEDPPIVGTGPFVASSTLYDDWVAGGPLTLFKNPVYHWGVDRGMEVQFDEIELSFFDDDTAMGLALLLGEIDVAKFPSQTFAAIEADVESGIIQDVHAENSLDPTGYWDEIGICMTDGGPNPSRLDPAIRQALAMSTDKTFILDNFRLGYGSEGSTLMSSVTDWHYEPTAGEKFEYNLTAANEMLEAAGYIDIDTNGIREATASSLAVTEGWVPEGTPLSYGMYVRMEVPEEDDIAQYLQAVWANVGIDLTYTILTEMEMSIYVYSYDYDMMIWDWWSDADPQLLMFTQTSMAVNGWSDTAYSSPAYDDSFNASVSALDPVERKTYLDNCQRIHYLDAPYIILTYLNQTYAWRTDTFTGWGDWSANPGRSISCYWSGNPLYFDLVPAVPGDNSPPEGLDLVADPNPALVGETVYFLAMASDPDGDALQFYIEYGDGATETQLSPGGDPYPQFAFFEHAYASEGSYLAWIYADDLNSTAGHNISMSLTVVVSTTIAYNRTMDYYWYDMFNVPFGSWWDYRLPVTGTDEPLTDSYPYMYRHEYSSGGQKIFAPLRLMALGTNLSEINMNDNPEFLPFFGTERGGNALVLWYLQYLTYAEAEAKLPSPIMPWYDGWFVSLNGTVMLDEQATLGVFGITPAEFDNFDAWWLANGDAFTTDMSDWFLYEANDRLDIFNMYEYWYQPFFVNLDAAKAGETVFLSYDTISWGMECLMARWLREAFMPAEWMYENMTILASIGPGKTDIILDTAVTDAVYAWAGHADSEPVWAWGSKYGDYVPSTLEHPISDFDPYAGQQHMWYSPGSAYDMMEDYEYTPSAFNLAENETMTFVWPQGDQLFLRDNGAGSWTEEYAPMVVRYSEPGPGDMPEQIMKNSVDKYMTFTGPIDFGTWSATQDTYLFLADEWARLGILPYGMPWIEFGMSGPNTPPNATFVVTPDTGTLDTVFSFDASGVTDAEDPAADLMVRWDWEDDGTYDTGWSTEKTATHQYDTLGTYTIRMEVADTGGMANSTTRSVEVTELEPPVTEATLDGTAGNAGWYLSDVTVTLDATDDSAVNYTTYSFDGGTWGDYTAPFDITTDGTHTVEFYSVDVLGNVEATKSVDVNIDTVDPDVSAVDLVGDMGDDGWFVSGIDVTITADDLTSGLDYVWGWVDSGDPEDFSGTVAIALEGEHTLHYEVADVAGNVVTGSEAFKIDSIAPVTTVTLTGTLGDDGWYVDFVTPEFDATDASSGVNVTMYRDELSTEWLVYPGTQLQLGATGVRVVEYYSIDNAGNVEATKSVTFNVDTDLPAVNYTGATVFEEIPVVISWTGSDVGSGVDRYETSLDGAAFVIRGTGTSLTIEDLEDGSEHTLVVRVYDSAGNMNSTTIAFEIDLGGGGIAGWILPLAIVLVIVAAVCIVAFFLMKRKKKGGEEQLEPPENV